MSRRIRRSQNGRVGIAVSATDGRRWSHPREPLQERLILRVVGEPVEHDGKLGIGEAFNDVAGLKVALAIAVGGEPPGSSVVDERIVEGLGHLVTERGNVAKVGIAKNGGRDPAGIIHRITTLAKAVTGATWLEVVGMVADDVALIGVVMLVKKRIGE
jgi:hypothetical protein